MLVNASTCNLSAVLGELTEAARANGLNDTHWAARAGLRKETLSRLRRRQSCDFSTLLALADAVDMNIKAVNAMPVLTSDGHFPEVLDWDYEEQLLSLCASRSLAPGRWAALGPNFFMAGLAVMLASIEGFDRPGMLALAEALHPGAGEPEVFSRWLQRSPLRPYRFLPMLDMAIKYAA